MAPNTRVLHDDSFHSRSRVIYCKRRCHQEEDPADAEVTDLNSLLRPPFSPLLAKNMVLSSPL